MNKHFIKEIKIKNFKCFEDFKAEGFGRVNLIGGKNNVGKTAFMEACYLNSSQDVLELYNRLLEIDTHRNIINNLLYGRDKKQDIEKIIRDNLDFKIDKISILIEKYIIKIATSINEEYEYSKLLELLDLNFIQAKSFHSINFISQDTTPDWLLNRLIGTSKLENKYHEINKFLEKVFNIEAIDIIDNLPYLKKDNQYVPLQQFGQGIKSFIDIIFSIVLSKNSIIFIDEIENGIHYTNLDKLWEIILTISKQQNVQVFATTHSKECIESYARVAKKLEDKEITMTTLARNPKGELKALVWNQKQFFSEMEQNHEVRGW